MNIPSQSDRLNIIEDVEINCKQKGHYHNVSVETYKEFLQDVTNQYPMFKNSITKSIDDPKNVIKEYIKFAHGGAEVDDIVKKSWFKNLLLTILKSAKTALKFAYNLIRRFGKYIRHEVTKNAVDTVTANALVIGFSLTLGGLVIGIVSAVVIIGLSIWFNKIDMKNKDIKTEKDWKDKIKKWKDILVNRAKGKPDNVELPEELRPPEPEAPNVSVSSFQEIIQETRLQETGLEVFGGIIFVIFLKAVIAYRFNEEMRDKVKYLKAIFSPTGLILALSSVLLLVGSGGASAAVAI